MAGEGKSGVTARGKHSALCDRGTEGQRGGVAGLEGQRGRGMAGVWKDTEGQRGAWRWRGTAEVREAVRICGSKWWREWNTESG